MGMGGGRIRRLDILVLISDQPSVTLSDRERARNESESLPTRESVQDLRLASRTGK